MIIFGELCLTWKCSCNGGTVPIALTNGLFHQFSCWDEWTVPTVQLPGRMDCSNSSVARTNGLFHQFSCQDALTVPTVQLPGQFGTFLQLYSCLGYFPSTAYYNMYVCLCLSVCLCQVKKLQMMLRQANDQLERTMAEKQELEDSVKLVNEEFTAKVGNPRRTDIQPLLYAHTADNNNNANMCVCVCVCVCVCARCWPWCRECRSLRACSPLSSRPSARPSRAHRTRW